MKVYYSKVWNISICVSEVEVMGRLRLSNGFGFTSTLEMLASHLITAFYIKQRYGESSQLMKHRWRAALP
jgi:hypothetical protein